jgi:hypothetical protein
MMRRNSGIVSNAAGNGSGCQVLFSSTYVFSIHFPAAVIHKRVRRFCDQRAAGTTGILPDMKIGGLCLFMFFVAFPLCEYGQSTAQIKGVIRGPQNAVMAGITVNLLSLERARTTKTDESGKFEFTELPLNNFELQVRQAGIKPVPVQEISFSEPSTRQVSIVLQLVASECFPKIEAAYENRIGRANLSGKIAKFSSSNTPLNNGRITATHIETGTTRVVNSNEKGHFEFVNLKPGKYTLKVSHQGYSELAGIDFWVTAENLTRLPTLYMFGKNDHSVILCQ